MVETATFTPLAKEHRLKPKDTCGVLLEQLLAALGESPAYVASCDVLPYSTLIRELGSARFDRSRHPEARDAPVADWPLDALGYALDSWVEASLDWSGASPPIPLFVLNAARFIQAHAWGRQFWEERVLWKLEPMLQSDDRLRGQRFEEQSLKSDITRCTQGTLVRLHVPAGCRIRASDGRLLVDSGGTAGFEIRRCHLSRGVNDFATAWAEEDAPRKFDIAEEFRVWGTLITPKPRRSPSPPKRPVRPNLDSLPVPGRWMTEWYTGEEKWEPIRYASQRINQTPA